MSVAAARKIPEWKIREVEELAELIKKHKVIAIASLENLPTKQLQLIRKKLRKRMVFRVTKNTLMERALKKVGIKNHEELVKHLTGPNLFIFANMNPFELALLLEKEKMSAPAKPGMVTDKEIVVPAGNTGIPPGPMLSTFGRLKIPTRVDKGTIWVSKDTVVAKPGDVISPELASLLQKLGIEPFEVGIKLKLVYDDGLILTADQLKIDLDEIRSQVTEAHLNALKVGIEIAYPVPEVLKLSVAKAHAAALAIAAEAGFVTPETAEQVLARAYAKALALIAALGDKAEELGLGEVAAQVQPQAPAEAEAKAEEAEEEEEEEEKASEEDIAAGLGALFG